MDVFCYADLYNRMMVETKPDLGDIFDIFFGGDIVVIPLVELHTTSLPR